MMNETEKTFDRPDIDLIVHTEQIRQLYQQTWLALTTVLVVGGSVCIALWYVIPPWKLVAWFGLYILVSIARGFLSNAFHRTSPTGADIYRWGRLHAMGSGASGFMWALAVIFLWPSASPAHQLVLPICIVALSAGAVATYYTWMPSYFSQFICSILPLSFRLISQEGSVNTILGFMGLFFIGFLTQTGKVMHAQSSRALDAGFRNQALNDVLSDEKAKQVELNAQLMHEISERRRSQKELELQNNILEELNAQLVETKNSLETANKQLEKALSEVKTLQGILPICSHCKKIRDGQGDWQVLEAYVRDRSNAQFSHGICPDCIKKYYSDLGDVG